MTLSFFFFFFFLRVILFIDTTKYIYRLKEFYKKKSVLLPLTLTYIASILYMYISLCNKIGDPFINSINEYFEKGEMPVSQKQAVITLIEKKKEKILLKYLLISGRQGVISIHGKVTVIKSLLIPKFVYVWSLLPTPKELVKDLNRLLFKFLWKGTGKVTRASPMNDFEHGGLK